jgi:CheY-like chemotaxis protein
VALTAYAGAEDIKRALASGFCAHIGKPVDASILSRIVAKLARQYKEADQKPSSDH